MTYQAIETKYLGPTNCRGARVKARAQAGSVTVCWDNALDPFENHRAAAMALAKRWGWSGRWAAGGRPNDSGYVFVRVSGDESEAT
jgi:hypothetical protein